jgi:hypothetical protein
MRVRNNTMSDKLYVTQQQYVAIFELIQKLTMDAILDEIMLHGQGMFEVAMTWPPIPKWSQRIDKKYIEGMKEILGRDIVPRSYELIVTEET